MKDFLPSPMGNEQAIARSNQARHPTSFQYTRGAFKAKAEPYAPQLGPQKMSRSIPRAK